MLAHKAEDEGIICVEHLAGKGKYYLNILFFSKMHNFCYLWCTSIRTIWPKPTVRFSTGGPSIKTKSGNVPFFLNFMMNSKIKGSEYFSIEINF